MFITVNCLSLNDNFIDKCPSLYFKCNNGNCVPVSDKCNSVDDCGDNSDENGCGMNLVEST